MVASGQGQPVVVELVVEPVLVVSVLVVLVVVVVVSFGFFVGTAQAPKSATVMNIHTENRLLLMGSSVDGRGEAPDTPSRRRIRARELARTVDGRRLA
jgi:hypothetical protein